MKPYRSNSTKHDPREARISEAREAWRRVFGREPSPGIDWLDYVTTVDGEPAVDVAKMYREALGVPNG